MNLLYLILQRVFKEQPEAEVETYQNEARALNKKLEEAKCSVVLEKLSQLRKTLTNRFGQQSMDKTG